MPELLTRDVLITRADTDQRTIEGRAVPYNDPIELWDGLFEQFAPDSIRTDDQTPKLFWQHREPIGAITAIDNRDDGAWITAKISATPRGDEALTLVRDGVLDRLSVGFLPIKDDLTEDHEAKTRTITRVEVLLREVSIVSFPAYPAAQITDTRTNHQEKKPMHDDNDATNTNIVTRADLDALPTRADIDHLTRQIETIAAGGVHVGAERDTRSAGEILKAIAANDAATIDRVNAWQNRAYTGFNPATDFPADLPDSFINLVKLVDDASTIAQLFSTGSLPAEGMTVPYLRLTSVTATIGNQAAAGDDLPGPAKVAYDSASAEIVVSGGWSELDIPRVQRMPVNVLDTLLQAMAIAAGKDLAAKFATKLKALHTSIKATRKITVTNWTDWKLWAPAIRQAVTAFRAAGVPVDGLLLDGASFDALAAVANLDGEPMFLAQGTAVNQAGALNLRQADGSLLTMPVHVFDAATTDFACFYASKAIVTRKDPIVTLQDQKIINLTKQWSIYQLSAICDELPGLLLPVVKA